MKKEKRGRVGQTDAEAAVSAAAKKEFSAAEAKACSLEAMMNGEECEACQ